MAAKTKVKERSAPREVIGAFTGEFADIGQRTIRSLQKDFLEASGKDFMSQLLSFSLGGGSEAPKPHAENAEKNTDPTKGQVEVFNAKNHKGEGAPKKKESRGEAHIHHGQEVRDALKTGIREEKKRIMTKLEQKQAELRQVISQTSKTEQTRLADYTIKDLSREATVYHSNLLDQIIKGAMMSKERATDSGSWLNAAKGKGAKRGDFSLANGKMHQSGERTTVQNAAG